MARATTTESDAPTSTPVFLYVVDTEGDAEWTHHRRVPPVRNLRAIPRFQALCDRYGIKPTYVVTHTVASDDEGVTMLKGYADAGRAEVGTHLHPWTTPPFVTPWDDSETFPHELPDDLLEAKLRTLTDTITERFGRAPTSYRAGRFGFDGRTARLLEALGYTVDSSVTPLMSWQQYPGIPGGVGGPDYREAPLAPYFVDRNDPRTPGDSRLFEIPLTIVEDTRGPELIGSYARQLASDHLAARVLGKLRVHRKLWLRPTMESVEGMVSSCAAVMRQRVPVFNMMIHSSELFPNTSPYFTDQAAVDRLFDRMDRAFAGIFRRWSPDALTLSAAARRLSLRH